MIVEVIMPKLGMYESDVTLIDWLVADGAQVAVGDVLFTMETDKVETEIECEDEGILVITAEPGLEAPIGTTIGFIVSSVDEVAAARAPRGRVVTATTPTVEECVAALREMVRIRIFEDRIRREFGKGDMPGFVHTYVGAEAVAVGICAHLAQSDVITSTHRGHGHCLAKGVEITPMIAELFGRETGLCKGRGGSMHIADFSRGVLGANAIVAGGVALAVGAAQAAQTLGDGRVAVTFFGDGASNEGVLHESMNLASIWKLPVIFVCENNGWAESTPSTYALSVPNVADRAAGYSMPSAIVDAGDYPAMHAAAGEAVARARSGGGPTLIEAKIARHTGHFVGDAEAYRSKQNRADARGTDVIKALRATLDEQGVDTAAVVSEVEQRVVAELDAALAAARQDPWPSADEVERYVYAD